MKMQEVFEEVSMKMQEGAFCGEVLQPLPTSVKAPLRRGPLRLPGRFWTNRLKNSKIRSEWNAGQHPVRTGNCNECVEAQNRCCAVNAAKMKDERGRL